MDQFVSDLYPDIPVDDSLPDPECLKAGDAYGVLQVRCYAASGLSDCAIVRRSLAALLDRWTADLVVTNLLNWDLPPEPDSVLVAVARYLAFVGFSEINIVAALIAIRDFIPDLTDDPDEIVFYARRAEREFSA